MSIIYTLLKYLLLKYSNTITFTHLKCLLQCFLVSSPYCNHHYNNYLQDILIIKNKPHICQQSSSSFIKFGLSLGFALYVPVVLLFFSILSSLLGFISLHLGSCVPIGGLFFLKVSPHPEAIPLFWGLLSAIPLFSSVFSSGILTPNP